MESLILLRYCFDDSSIHSRLWCNQAGKPCAGKRVLVIVAALLNLMPRVAAVAWIASVTIPGFTTVSITLSSLGIMCTVCAGSLWGSRCLYRYLKRQRCQVQEQVLFNNPARQERAFDKLAPQEKEIAWHIMSTKEGIRRKLEQDFTMLCSIDSLVTPQNIKNLINKYIIEMQQKLEAAKPLFHFETDVNNIGVKYNQQLDLFLTELDRRTKPYQTIIKTITEHFERLKQGTYMFDEAEHVTYVNQLKPLAAIYAELNNCLDQYFPKDALASQKIVTILEPHPEAQERLAEYMEQERLKQERLEQKRRLEEERLEQERQRREQQRLEEEDRQQRKELLQNALGKVNESIAFAQKINPFRSPDETIMGVGYCSGSTAQRYKENFLLPRMNELLKSALEFHRIEDEIPKMTRASVLEWYQQLIKDERINTYTSAKIDAGLKSIEGHNIRDNSMLDPGSPCEAYMKSLGLVRLLFDKYPNHENMSTLLVTTFSYIEDQAEHCATGARGRATLTFQAALGFLVNL